MLSSEGEDWAVVSLNLPGDGLFEDEIAEFEELVDGASGWLAKRRVKKVLGGCKAIVSFQVLSGDTEGSEVMDRLQSVFMAMLDAWPGLMHADRDGFYDKRGHVLATD